MNEQKDIPGEALVFNSLEAFERVDQDLELFFELVALFFEEYDHALSELRSAIHRQDAVLLEERAHSLKSALGNLGAMQAFQNALALESAGREHNFDGAAERLQALESAVVQFSDALQPYRMLDASRSER